MPSSKPAPVYCPPGLLRPGWPDIVREYHRRHFGAIVRHACVHHPFFRRHIPDPACDVPVFGRDIVQQHNDELLNGHPVTSRTSGSSGMPLRIAHSPARSRLNGEQTAKILRMVGCDFGRAASIVYAGQHEGKRNVLDIHTPLAEQADFLRRAFDRDGINALVTYPSNALELAAHVVRERLDMSFVGWVVGISESLDEQDEAHILAGFPAARIWSNYSASEFGMIAFRCPFEPRFHHVVAEKLGLEVLDQNGRPCADDQPGRVVITDFFNDWMPFIRYDIGDVAVPGQCPCGRIPAPALHHIAGKVRGMLKAPDGTPVMFVELSAALRDIEGIKQYQVIQDDLTSFTLRYVLTDQALCERVVAGARDVFARHWPYPHQLALVEETRIEKHPNGKFFASICNA